MALMTREQSRRSGWPLREAWVGWLGSVVLGLHARLISLGTQPERSIGGEAQDTN